MKDNRPHDRLDTLHLLQAGQRENFDLRVGNRKHNLTASLVEDTQAGKQEHTQTQRGTDTQTQRRTDTETPTRTDIQTHKKTRSYVPSTDTQIFRRLPTYTHRNT